MADNDEGRRKLVAILVADVAGYSRLMGDDERATVATLDAYRDVFRTHIGAHDGRVVDTAGDSVLATFDSVVAAVQCAVDVQEALASLNADLPDDRRMRFRIGVNLGDVIAKRDGTIYGDGVNVAARLESLAEPGGVCVSGTVHDSVEGKLAVAFRSIGEQTVKNIARPVRAYVVEQESRSGAGSETPLDLPDRPSIAVLPFVNMSGDSEQEYFADGVTEDLITALSRIRWFFVIARNSTFAYKGRSPDVREVARDLGVRYVLEGSVRKAGARVRISAQLIEGATGNHVWAKRYDRELEDIFALQDELTETIVGAIEPELSKAERDRAKVKKPENLDAWDLYLRGLSALYRRTKADHEEAKRLFGGALDLDPTLGAAHAALVDAFFYDFTYGFAGSRDECCAQARRAARRALELDPEDPAAHCAMGKAAIVCKRHLEAIPELEAALELNPSLAWAHYGLGAALVFSGKAEHGIPHLDKAIRLSPHDPHMGSFLVRMADAHIFMRRYEDAVAWARKAIGQPNFQWSRHAALISALGHLGRLGEAREVLDEALRPRPDFSRSFVRDTHLIADGADFDHYIDGLEKAGVPEHPPAAH